MKQVENFKKIETPRIPEDMDYDGLFDDLLKKYTRNYKLTDVKTVNLGTLYELRYDIDLATDMVPKAFLDEIRARNGNLSVSCCRIALELSNQMQRFRKKDLMRGSEVQAFAWPHIQFVLNPVHF